MCFEPYVLKSTSYVIVEAHDVHFKAHFILTYFALRKLSTCMHVALVALPDWLGLWSLRLIDSHPPHYFE